MSESKTYITGLTPKQPGGSALFRMFRGAKGACPNCGKGKLFKKYLKPADQCGVCGTELGHIRADDFPPYVTMFIVGHVIVPLILVAERLYQPETWMHMAVWPVLAIALTLALLPIVKGAIVGLMYHLNLSGDETQ